MCHAYTCLLPGTPDRPSFSHMMGGIHLQQAERFQKITQTESLERLAIKAFPDMIVFLSSLIFEVFWEELQAITL